MVFHMSDFLYFISPLLLLKFYTSYGPFMTSLVYYLNRFSSFIALRLGLFSAFSLCFSSFDLIGSPHVTIISFLGSHHNAFLLPMNYHTHVTYLYIVFLRSGTNLEGNNKDLSFRYRLQHNFEYAIEHNYARPRDFRGSQTLFSKKRNSYFFLLSPEVSSLKIVTNHPGLKPLKISSNSARPNFNFIAAHFVSGIMRFLNWAIHLSKTNSLPPFAGIS